MVTAASAAGDLAFNKYSFLADLGLSALNMGCYRRGEWVGRGDEQVSLNPHNNERVAVTKCASTADYQDCIQAMAEERKTW